MKRLPIYLILILSIATLPGLNSCNSDDNNNPNTELPPNITGKVELQIGSQTFILSLYNNATAQAFSQLLPITITMDDVNANEKFCRLPQYLPGTSTNPGTIRTGDLMAYGGNGLVLFYKTFTTSYSYAPIGTIDDPSGLQAALGTGSVTVTFAKQIRL